EPAAAQNDADPTPTRIAPIVVPESESAETREGQTGEDVLPGGENTDDVLEGEADPADSADPADLIEGSAEPETAPIVAPEAETETNEASSSETTSDPSSPGTTGEQINTSSNEAAGSAEESGSFDEPEAEAVVLERPQALPELGADGVPLIQWIALLLIVTSLGGGVVLVGVALFLAIRRA
ncbi:MAG: hypothetical protein AAF633_26165, partial [Chloroflexota bacterium]